MARRKFDPNRNAANVITPLEPTDNGGGNHKLYYGERVKALRTAAQLTQAELAGKLGLSRSAILNWELGRTRPDISNIPALCRAVNVPISDFFSDSDEAAIGREEMKLLQAYRNASPAHQRFLRKMAQELETMDQVSQRDKPRIRLLIVPYAEDAVAAGVGTAGFEAACRPCYVHDTPLLREADLLFRVNGDSMEPVYRNGCTVMVKKDTQLKTGEIGVFSVDGILFVKEYQPDGLCSLNPDYPMMRASQFNEIQLIGRVTGILNEDDFASEDEIDGYHAQK